MTIGLLITFEGPEGVGKTTQARKLYTYLQGKNCHPVYIHEPGSTKLGEEVRKILLHAHNLTINERAELMLFLACRAQIAEEVIAPSLAAGKVVIMDRFIDSSEAYQGWGRRIGSDRVRELNDFATGGIKPDLTFLLDVDLDIGLRRKEGVSPGRRDRLEQESREFHRTVKEGYLKIARREPERIKLIEAGDKTVEEVHSIVVKYVDSLLSVHVLKYQVSRDT
jgi:dTMP kinase